jgi:hypothetical protein
MMSKEKRQVRKGLPFFYPASNVLTGGPCLFIFERTLKYGPE